MVANPDTVRPIRRFIPDEPLFLDFHGSRLTDEQFEELCLNNPDLSFEITGKGELIIVPPTSTESSWKNADLVTDLNVWSRKDGTGIIFESNALFIFPDGAKRSPDVAWILRERYEKLGRAERRGFTHIVPDFVVELMSPTDDLFEAQAKMEEYIGNGVRLGWLIDPDNRQAYIYRANGEVEMLDDPQTLSGEDVLDGLELDITRIW